jgi:hypothetical protein
VLLVSPGDIISEWAGGIVGIRMQAPKTTPKPATKQLNDSFVVTWS